MQRRIEVAEKNGKFIFISSHCATYNTVSSFKGMKLHPLVVLQRQIPTAEERILNYIIVVQQTTCHHLGVKSRAAGVPVQRHTAWITAADATTGPHVTVTLRGLQRDVVYLGWPLALSYMSPNAKGGGVVGSQPMNTAVHRSPNNLWRSDSILNLLVTLDEMQADTHISRGRDIFKIKFH
jgi:hypothetical protein